MLARDAGSQEPMNNKKDIDINQNDHVVGSLPLHDIALAHELSDAEK
jgi:hypothetical protein